MALIAADTHYLVVGLGATGLSCVRYLVAQGKLCSVIDSRQTPPGLDTLRAEFPNVEVTLGGFDADVMTRVDVLVMSPGVPLSTPAVQVALANGVRLSSDIELFCQAHQGRTVLITGSNAKSTVTSWLADIARRAGLSYVVGGNLGQPALTLLEEPVELAILELSSFQLELVGPLRADVATVLNVSEDIRTVTQALPPTSKPSSVFTLAAVMRSITGTMFSPHRCCQPVSPRQPLAWASPI